MRAPAESSKPVVAESAEPRPFFVQIGGAFLYPLKGNGPWLILGYVLFMIASYLLSYAQGTGATILSLLIPSYLCAYVFKIVLTTADGEAEPPDWPDFAHFWEEIVQPAGLFIGSLLFCALPAIAYAISKVSFSDEGDPHFNGSMHMVRSLLVVGCVFLPMAVLSAAMHDSLRGLNPLLILGAIIKIPLQYAVAVMALLLVLALSVAAGSLLQIPLVSIVAYCAIVLYAMMVEARIIGLIYAANATRLNWFDEASDRRRDSQKVH
ncbi:MAG: DUF4013 domain-containing protein [Phycisphaerae bacterium]|jgi:hypothetical protein